MQATLRTSAHFQGLGLHAGLPVQMSVLPAQAGHGIVFHRTDIGGMQGRIEARWDQVVPSKLCTVLANRAGAQVSTVEHLMAALAGCGIHNALIEIDGPEVPILDGSAAPFVRAFLAAGVQELGAPLTLLSVLRPVEVTQGQARAALAPADIFEIDFQISFADAAIGAQGKTLNMANGAFVRELCDSRTFCRQADVDFMRQNGLALGGTLENAVVFDGARVLSPGGLRHRDEPVRHKMLDALGDLALAGAPILGRYTGVRAGHALTNRLLHALFADPRNYAWVGVSQTNGGKLPGVGITRADLVQHA